METERPFVEGQDPPVGQEGADQGDEFAQNTEEQLFGEEESTQPPGEASKGKPEGESEIPLETVQAHPVFADLQSKYDRQSNVLKYQGEQIGQLNERLKGFHDRQAAELLEQLGDTLENRDLVKLIQSAQDKEAEAMAVIQQFGPILKREKGTELLRQEGIPMDYLDDLVACETFEEAVQKVKTIKSVLAKMPKQAPSQKGGGTTKPQRQPAIAHVPDKGQGSVAPQDFAQAEDAYIAGKIGFAQYKQAADKAGVHLQ